jgi:hypothetical protein
MSQYAIKDVLSVKSDLNLFKVASNIIRPLYSSDLHRSYYMQNLRGQLTLFSRQIPNIIKVRYCDMTPESRNNEARRNRPLCSNGWVNTFPWQWIHIQ